MSSIIWQQIQAELKEFEDIEPDYNPDYAKSQEGIIQLIDFYWMSKFRDGPTDNTGYKKAFYNIVVNPVEVASKMTDLDTKDIKIVATNGVSYYPAWLFEKELNFWMKDTKNEDGQTFGQLLNSMIYNWPKYGHLLAKKAGDTVHIVPLENVINRPDAKRILDSDYVIEKHEFTPDRLRQMGWDNVEEVIAKHAGDEGLITIYERHGEIGDSTDNYFIVPAEGEDDEILYSNNISRDKLYKELVWDSIPGRALGRGVAERLFEAQIAKNQNENLLRSGYRWTSKHIYQTRDDVIAKNLITDIEDGDLMIVNSEITPIAVEERNLPAINTGDAKWDRNASEMTFSFEPLSGQRPPSGVPLGTTVLQTRLSGQYYQLKQEDLGLFLKEILYDWILPSFKGQKNIEHSLMVSEFDEAELDKFRGLILKNRTNKSVLNFIDRNKRIPSTEEAEVLKGIAQEQLKTAKEVKIPKGFYDNLKYKIDIIITGEQIDVAAKMATLQTVLQIIGANPTILRDPRTRKVFFKLLDLSGVSPIDLGLDERTAMEDVVEDQVAERGGSVARPAAPPTIPQTAAVPRRL